MKKILAAVLAIVICLGMTSGVFAAGKEFTDVSPSDWFYNDVKTAVELGLVNGRSETTYAPSDKLTYAEAVKLAACMHQLYTTGKIDFGTGDPWYMPYAEYCKNNGITKKEYTYQETATRAGYMEIFANALPGDGLKQINFVADNSIPDVPSSAEYAEGVYKLYRAGILQGMDEFHNCNPFFNITRAEVAAILTRMMDTDKRVKFTLGEEDKADKVEKEEEKIEPLTVNKQPIGGTLDVGGTIKTNIIAEGGVEPYTYQWEYNDGSEWKNVTASLGTVSGEKSAKISIKSESPASYKVRCVIKDSKGNKVVTEATDFIFKGQDKFRIVRQPEGVTSPLDIPLSTRVEVAGGKEPYEYVWACDADGTLYSLASAPSCSGADKAELIYVATEPNTLTVCCTITDATGKRLQTEFVDLVATPSQKEKVEEKPVVEEKPAEEPFELVKAPKSIKTGIDETAVFEVEVKGGTAPYTYQWYYECGGWLKLDEQEISGLTGSTSPKMTLTRSVAEILDIKCEIIDATGKKIITPTVKLTIENNKPLGFTSQPENVTVKVGEKAILPVNVENGAGELQYQWQMDISGKGGWVRMSDSEGAIAGTTTNELTLESKAASEITVRCVVTDASGSRIESNGIKVKFE